MNIDRARRAGALAAHQVITAQAGAGMTADQIEVGAEHVLGDRFDQPTAVSEAFYAAYDRTAGTYVADLRELEAE